MQPTQHDPYNYQPPQPQDDYGAAPVPLTAPALGTQATPAVDTRARNAAIALVVCGLLLLIGLISRAWFSTRGGNVGLLGVEECRGAICRGMSWFDINRAP